MTRREPVKSTDPYDLTEKLDAARALTLMLADRVPVRSVIVEASTITINLDDPTAAETAVELLGLGHRGAVGPTTIWDGIRDGHYLVLNGRAKPEPITPLRRRPARKGRSW